MKNILKSIVFFAVVLFLAPYIFAQTPSSSSSSTLQRWFCLQPVRTGIHTSSLTVKEGVAIASAKPTYVVAKIAFNSGDINPDSNTSAMTSGKGSLDSYIFNSTQGLTDLQQKLGFTGGISQGTNPTNTFPVIWTDDLSKTNGSSDERAHFWYGMQESDSTGTGENGSLGSQQQGTFAFSQAKGATDCEYISWDPFGYVFDSVTLGPIKGVYVRLLTSATENGVYTPVPVGIGAGKVTQNPVTTNNDGSYKFYIDPGFYKLELVGDVAHSNTKYIIEKNIHNIKAEYAQFGYQQLYIAEKPEIIHEQAGTAERRDIAIETIGAPAPFLADGPKLTDIVINRSQQNGVAQVRVSGRALFIPMDLVALYKDLNNNIIEQKIFSLNHGHSFVPQNSTDERNFDIWMDGATKDGKGILMEIKTTSKYSTKTFSYTVDPMPSYLEGIANDSAAQPVVGGTVGVYPVGSNKPTFKTSTDENGHFIITTDQLPLFPFTLLYTTVGGDEIKISTTEYLKQNANYHKANMINSYVVKIAQKSPNTTQTQTINPSISPTPQSTADMLSEKSLYSRLWKIVAIVAIFVIGIGIGTFIFIRSKQKPYVPPVA